jgi:hypothetical protein
LAFRPRACVGRRAGRVTEEERSARRERGHAERYASPRRISFGLAWHDERKCSPRTLS